MFEYTKSHWEQNNSVSRFEKNEQKIQVASLRNIIRRIKIFSKL